MNDWLWLIPVLPLLGAAVNGAIALFTRWKPNMVAPAGGHETERAATQPADAEPIGPAVGGHGDASIASAARASAGGEPASVAADAGGRVPGEHAGWIACAAMALSFLVAAVAFVELAGQAAHQRGLEQDLFTWIRAGTIDIRAGLLFDPLSGLMTLIVTGVGLLIHVYSLGYMAHDENRDRYFSYLNLFAGMMLILVLGDSLPLLFVGWEGVGLCSYLLIGFWYTDLDKAKAGKKAFVVNRVGDLGFLLGMFTLFVAAPAAGMGTLSFETLREVSPALASSGLLTAACLLLFVGAAGKSAQFPLYIWLPDAMAGPTPVSALIHAATMVTAGVYMIARLSFLFSQSTVACAVIAIVGAFTALFAATLGFVQNDVKKVLAYSTVSQLGFMVLAVGAGGYAAGIYHLTTHAFFKALLFLAAGSLIHAMSHALPAGADPNDIRSMGGLRRKMKWTWLTFACGWAAIVGVPLTSGFFSKDEVLASVKHSELIPHGLAAALFWVGLLAAACTAFYMTRLLILVFLGKPRMGAGAEAKVHESSKSMVVPMGILAVLSLLAGIVLWIPQAPIVGAHQELLLQWLNPVFGGPVATAHGELHAVPVPELILLTFLAVMAFAAGTAIAWLFYVKNPLLPRQAASMMHGTPYRALWAKYWIDEMAEGLFVKPVYAVSRSVLWKGIDTGVIDGAVNGAGSLARAGAGFVSRRQTGFVQSYALGITLGVAGLALYILSRFPR